MKYPVLVHLIYTVPIIMSTTLTHTVNSFHSLGTNFRGLTMVLMFVDAFIRGFQIIYMQYNYM